MRYKLMFCHARLRAKLALKPRGHTLNSTLRRLVLSTIATAGLIAGMAVPSAQAASGFPDLVWFNATSGVVGSWLLDGAGHVTGTQDLNWTCGSASHTGCVNPSQWRPIGVGDMNGDGHQDLVWFNATSGVVGSWRLDGAGHVTGTQDLNWTCGTASHTGCVNPSQWRPVGIARGGM
jgi:hypothetical protein